MNIPISITRMSGSTLEPSMENPYYSVFLISGKGVFSVDFVNYSYDGDTVICVSPYQHFELHNKPDIMVEELRFHGDFYCIEYHKNEVACNGLLFNNIYLQPNVPLASGMYEELRILFSRIEKELSQASDFSDAVMKSYLQLILALCSREKSKFIELPPVTNLPVREIADFQRLLEAHFLRERNVSFYAAELALSPNAFSKKIRQLFGKTPTHLIQERVILEAKKLLHLTYKSVKEIAMDLNFEDEFYFSRYFKKGVGVSPQHYRSEVGISIVAQKSME